MPQPSEHQGDFAAALRLADLEVPADIAADRSGKAEKRFNIYRNNVAVAEVDTLQATFGVVSQLVGEEFFRATARLYATENPPTSPLLFRYGASFPDFLENFPPAQKVPYLGDVARIEWARLQAYHAADATPIGIEALSGFAEDVVGDCRLRLHPSVNILQSEHAAFSIWAATSGLISSDGIDPKHAEETMIVRPALAVDTICLPPGGYAFIASLHTHQSLADAAETAAKVEPGFDLANHLGGLFSAGAVVEILAPS
ncbi:MAG: DNA-binding domain-containing protein [Pseudomonadota bacterium]